MKKNTYNRNLYGKANYDGQYSTLIKIIIGVLLVLLIVYLGTALATGEIKLNKPKYEYKPTDSTIQYEELSKGQILNRGEKEYYALIFDFSDPNATLYLKLVDDYKEKENSLNIYTVDIGKEFNKSLIANEDEKYSEKPSALNDLKVVKDVTLLKIKDKKVIERTENKEKVLEILNKMI